MSRVTLWAQVLELAYVVTDLSAHLGGTGKKEMFSFYSSQKTCLASLNPRLGMCAAPWWRHSPFDWSFAPSRPEAVRDPGKFQASSCISDWPCGFLALPHFISIFLSWPWFCWLQVQHGTEKHQAYIDCQASSHNCIKFCLINTSVGKSRFRFVRIENDIIIYK